MMINNLSDFSQKRSSFGKTFLNSLIFLRFFLFIQVREDSGEDGSANGMVGAADGARHNAKGCFRVDG